MKLEYIINKIKTKINQTKEFSKYESDLNELIKEEEISHDFFLTLHKKIFQKINPNMAGKYRKCFVKIKYYTPPNWQDVERLMNQLIEFIKKNKENKMNPIELAARTYYKFEYIHPFEDGNGRIGRLIMNHILWHNDLPTMVIGNKQKGFYKALRKDENTFINYFLRIYLFKHKDYLE